MATNGLAAWHGTTTHNARVGRNLTSAIMGQPVATFTNSATDTTRGGAYGVSGGPASMKVTTTGSLGFSVAPGRVVGVGTSATAQGAYEGYNDAAYTDSVDARDATNPRIDYVAWRVRDTDEDATTFEDDGIVKITGTPAATPAPPAVGAGLGSLVILCEVLVPSSASGAALTFTDRRQYAAALGGRKLCTSTTRPSGVGVWEGVEIRELDSHSDLIYDGTTWRYQYKPIAQWNGAGTGAANLTGATLSTYYSISNNLVHFHGFITLGASSAIGTGFFNYTLPITSNGSGIKGGYCSIGDTSANLSYAARAFINSTGVVTFSPTNASGSNGQVTATSPITWATGDFVEFDISYQAA
jgi:hypothetical protein